MSKYVHAEISKRRLEKELVKITNEPLPGISVGLKGDNIYEWEATIQGPPDTPYEGGNFVLDMIFPENYPIEPPVVTFRTEIYHRDVNSDGKLNLDILGKHWTPVLTVEKLLPFILSLLNDRDALNDRDSVTYIAQFNINREEHDQVCKDRTKKYAS